MLRTLQGLAQALLGLQERRRVGVLGRAQQGLQALRLGSGLALCAGQRLFGCVLGRGKISLGLLKRLLHGLGNAPGVCLALGAALQLALCVCPALLVVASIPVL